MTQRNPNDEMAARITALIDGAIRDERERAQAEADLAAHPHLQTQHAVESALVATLHARRDRLRAALPPSLERSVRMAVHEAAQPNPSVLDRIIGALRRPAVAFPALAGIAAVVVLVLTNGGPATTDQPRVTTEVAAASLDLPTASYANYQAIKQGKLTLAKATNDANELKTFFAKEGVGYEVIFPKMEAELKGGVVSEHNGHKYAHLVFAAGDHLVYMFEVDQASIDSKTVDLGSRVNDDLAQSRWHWEERADTGTLFVWKSNNVVCSAVSDLRTDQFSALFALEEL